MPDASSMPSPVYRSWTTDSGRWRRYHPRHGDIVIGTYPKSGTTWMQRIVDLLVFQSPQPRPIDEASPWIDGRMTPIDEVISHLEQQQHRRFVKSHLPFDALPYYDAVRYIHVGRDGRDACMSYFNHCAAFTPAMYQRLDQVAADMGGPAPRFTGDARVFWHDWLTRGVVPGSHDGFPAFSFFDFEASWWRARHYGNVLLVHYNDLKTDLAGEMRRIARFLDIDIGTSNWDRLVEAASFQAMKRDGDSLLPKVGKAFQGGTKRFIYKGCNGRWREQIPAEEQARYARMAAQRFTPGLRRWIEHGRLRSGDPTQLPD